MLGMQGTALWAFTAVASLFGPHGRHVLPISIWCVVQTGFVLLLGSWNLTNLAGLLPEGFELHRGWLELHHVGSTGADLPQTQWPALAAGIALATIGSAATGGLTGSFLIAHTLNYAALFGAFWLRQIRDPAAAMGMDFILVAQPLDQVCLLLAGGMIHIGLCSLAWRRGRRPEAVWKGRKPVLWSAAALAAVGVLAGYV